MSTLVIDTHRVSKILRSNGFTEEQAEGVLKAMSDIDLSGVASKMDLAELKSEIFRFIIIVAGVQVAAIGVMFTLFGILMR